MVRGSGAHAARRRGGGADRHRRFRGQPSGGVSVGTDQGDYTAKFKELSFDGQNMKARYEFPLDSQADVTVAGTFNGGEAEGTWTLVARRKKPGLAILIRWRARWK